MMSKWSIITLLLLLLCLGCNQPFDPRGPLDQKMAVFSILSTVSDVQYVRVELDYMPVGFDPLSHNSNNAAKDVFVTLVDGSTLYELSDTTLSRTDTSRYKSPLYLYALNPSTIRHGGKYQVVVQSLSMGVLSSSVTVPDKPLLDSTLSMSYILNSPLSHQPDESIDFPAVLSGPAKGYLPRLYVCYDVFKGSEWVEESADIPIATDDTAAFSLNMAVYPKLTVSPSSGKVIVTYKNGFLQNIIKSITKVKYANNRLVYKWIVFLLVQADENLYNYYSALHQYRDPRSIRLDQPFFTEMNGGIGFVGAYSADSLVYILPSNFGGNR